MTTQHLMHIPPLRDAPHILDDLQEDISIQINSLKYGNMLLKCTEPLIFDIKRDEREGLFIIEDDALNIFVYGDSIDKILRELSSNLIFLWEEYAKAENETLTKSAISFKLNLKNLLIAA